VPGWHATKTSAKSAVVSIRLVFVTGD